MESISRRKEPMMRYPLKLLFYPVSRRRRLKSKVNLSQSVYHSPAPPPVKVGHGRYFCFTDSDVLQIPGSVSNKNQKQAPNLIFRVLLQA